MNKVSESADQAIYRKNPRVLLLFAASVGLMGALGIVFGAWPLACVVLILMSLITCVVGLYSQSLALDFRNRKLRYESRIAGYLITKIDDGFDRVTSIWIYDNSVHTKRGSIETQPEWNLELIYEGSPSAAMLLGVFVTEEAAVREAELLSQKMNVRIETKAPITKFE